MSGCGACWFWVSRPWCGWAGGPGRVVFGLHPEAGAPTRPTLGAQMTLGVQDGSQLRGRQTHQVSVTESP